MHAIPGTITEHNPIPVPEGWVKSGEFVTLWMPTDDPEVAHHYLTSVNDLLRDPDPYNAVRLAEQDEPASVAVIECRYTVQVAKVSDALARVSELHGLAEVVWSHGPAYIAEPDTNDYSVKEVS